jgi:hypothetical protein
MAMCNDVLRVVGFVEVVGIVGFQGISWSNFALYLASFESYKPRCR